MSLWAITFIILIIVMAIGPLMLIRPSRHERYLSAHRQEAVILGLHIKPINHSKRRCQAILYSLPIHPPQARKQQILVRQAYSHELHAYQYWESDVGKNDIAEPLKQWLDNLPTCIIGIKYNTTSLGVWLEENNTSLSAQQIKALLLSLKDIL